MNHIISDGEFTDEKLINPLDSFPLVDSTYVFTNIFKFSQLILIRKLIMPRGQHAT